MADQAVIKGGYYPSWSPSTLLSSIDTNHFTHIYYAFIKPNYKTFEIEIDQTKARELEKFTSTLHQKKPPVKTLLSFGGYDENLLIGWARMALDSNSRLKFIRSCIHVARKHGFDGIDLDWEFPQNPTEMENFGALLDQFRVEIENEASGSTNHRPLLLLTAAVNYSAEIDYQDNLKYPAASMSKNLDWVNIMTYDYHGPWEKKPNHTGAHAALFDWNSNKSTFHGLCSWIESGVPKSKLIMGLPLYGRTWKLSDPRVHGIGAPADGVGLGSNDKIGDESDGVLTYAAVMTFNTAHNAKVVHDLRTCSDYSFAGKDWVTYDDTETVHMKIHHARGLRLGGYFFWSINQDHLDWRISKTASQSWSSKSDEESSSLSFE